MGSEPITITAVISSPRLKRALLAVADETGTPVHQLGEAAIVAFLETHGHHRRGPERGTRCGTRRARKG